jgi:hypothetical protein
MSNTVTSKAELDEIFGQPIAVAITKEIDCITAPSLKNRRLWSSPCQARKGSTVRLAVILPVSTRA